MENLNRETVPHLRHTNDAIAVYVTAGARIHLYGYIAWLREKAIFCDSDSDIFIHPRNDPWSIATWYKLGDMQPEMQ